MQRFFGWLSEQERRRYAALEAAQLGHGGLEYSARLLAGAPHTIRQGLHALAEPTDAAAGRLRKQGEAARRAPSRSPPEKGTAALCGRRARRATPGVPACCGRTCRCARWHAGWWRWGPPPGGGRADGGGAHAREAAAPPGSKTRWAIIATAPPHVHPWRGDDARRRPLAMRCLPAIRKSRQGWAMCSGLAQPAPLQPSHPSSTTWARRAKASGGLTGLMPSCTSTRPCTSIPATTPAPGGALAWPCGGRRRAVWPLPRRSASWGWETGAGALVPHRPCARKTGKGWPIGEALRDVAPTIRRPVPSPIRLHTRCARTARALARG